MDGNQLGLKTIFLGMVFNKTPIKMLMFIRGMVRFMVRVTRALMAASFTMESTASMTVSPESLMVTLW